MLGNVSIIVTPFSSFQASCQCHDIMANRHHHHCHHQQQQQQQQQQHHFHHYQQQQQDARPLRSPCAAGPRRAGPAEEVCRDRDGEGAGGRSSATCTLNAHFNPRQPSSHSAQRPAMCCVCGVCGVCVWCATFIRAGRGNGRRRRSSSTPLHFTTIRGDQGHLMLWHRILPQPEVIRAI